MASQLRRFLDELKRRKVCWMAVVYAAVAFVIWQVAGSTAAPLAESVD
jgi:hypothetical protein